MSEQAASFAVVAIFHARAGKSEELGRQLLSLVAPTRQEEGSRLYHICRSSADGAEWLVMENWRDRAAFDFHMATPYVGAFMQQVPLLCAREPDIRFLDIASPGYPGQAQAPAPASSRRADGHETPE
ncbi:hypothetical protein B0920_12235 [Massilia sp. KIM]|uniref:putative quinol monooxygenase n=1 Tax=Massilia sp. KIM TaxID=1955422 RepID=UPI00098F252B|nr:putative quinol monooxygenase [Massilia sp. KIM]OON64061.1 hypothetical protein B0920_12235 [Massilia sp. KIM]